MGEGMLVLSQLRAATLSAPDSIPMYKFIHMCSYVVSHLLIVKDFLIYQPIAAR